MLKNLWSKYLGKIKEVTGEEYEPEFTIMLFTYIIYGDDSRESFVRAMGKDANSKIPREQQDLMYWYSNLNSRYYTFNFDKGIQIFDREKIKSIKIIEKKI